MPTAESVRGAFGRISGGLDFLSKKKSEKKDREFQFEKLMADIENMKAGREIQREGLDLEGERMDIGKEEFSKTFGLALREVLLKEGKSKVEIDKILAQTKEITARTGLIGAQTEGAKATTGLTTAKTETEVAKLPGVEADAATKVAKGKLDTSAFGTLYRGLENRPPMTLQGTIEKDKLKRAEEITGIGKPPTSAGQVTDKDKWKAYQALAKVLTLMGDPAYTDEQRWAIVNAQPPEPAPDTTGIAPAPGGAPAPAAITPTPGVVTPPTPVAITPAGQAPTGVPAAINVQEENPTDFIPAGDTQPRAGFPVDTAPTPSTDIEPEDTPEIMVSKIEATLGAFNKLTPEQQRAMERNMHTDYPDRAVKVMAILRGQ